MATLRQISEDLRALDDLLEEIGGDISEADAEAAIDQWLAENRANLNKKLDGYCTLIQKRLDSESGRKEEANRLLSLARHDGNAAKTLKERLLWFFQQHPDLGGKVETDLYKIAVAKNGGAAPVEVITSLSPQEALGYPDLKQFVRVTYSWDLTAIGQALRADQVPEDFAREGQRGEHLRIR